MVRQLQLSREEVIATRATTFNSLQSISEGHVNYDDDVDSTGVSEDGDEQSPQLSTSERTRLEQLLNNRANKQLRLWRDEQRAETAPSDPSNNGISGTAATASPRRRATYPATMSINTEEGNRRLEEASSSSPPPSFKRARTEADMTIATLHANTSSFSVGTHIDTSKNGINTSTSLTSANTSMNKKGKSRAKKSLPEPWTCKDFRTRFPTPAMFVKYLNGTPDERHPIVFHRDAPLSGVRAHFVSLSKSLTKSMAVNMNHLFRLGGQVHETFLSPFRSSSSIALDTSSDSFTTHIIVYSEGSGASMKFKDVLKILAMADEAALVGQSVADGEHSTTSRQIWVIRSDWLVECVKQADQKRLSGIGTSGANAQKVKRVSEMGYLVECEGDKKRRKNFLLKKMSSASIVVDPPPMDMHEFQMPESQISTQEAATRNNPAAESQQSLTVHMNNLNNESPMSFDDMALEIDLARNDLDKLSSDNEDESHVAIGSEVEQVPESAEEQESSDTDTNKNNDDDGDEDLGLPSEPILAGTYFTIPSKRKEIVESDECPTDREASFRAGKEREKSQVTREARARKRANGEKYRCDVSSTAGAMKDGPNEDVANKFDQLALFYEKSKVPNAWWRVKGYRTAAGALRNVGRRIETYEDAIKLPGIGEKTALKLLEIVQTGKSTHLECKTAQDRVEELFTGIYGVGPSKAKEWYDAGMRTLEDVKECKTFGIHMTYAQELGLKYYDVLQERIPRAEVARHLQKIHRAALSVDHYLIVECMGSFRRGETLFWNFVVYSDLFTLGQADCGDVDIIVTRSTDDGKDHAGLVQRLVETLFAQGVISYTLSNPDDWRSLDAKWMGLLYGENAKMRRIDILGVPYDELGAALIYFTGNDIFNRSLRLKARHLGYSLNQRGLFKDVIRDKKTGLKLTSGERIASRTEQEIFEKLGTKWRPPNERLP